MSLKVEIDLNDDDVLDIGRAAAVAGVSIADFMLGVSLARADRVNQVVAMSLAAAVAGEEDDNDESTRPTTGPGRDRPRRRRRVSELPHE